MNYYYDVLLNFSENEVWNFYEWEETDPLLFAKKIPLFRVSFEVIQDFLKFYICLDSDFVKQIAHKAVFQEKEDIYATFLVSDAKNSFAVKVNEEGSVEGISKLMIRDDNNLNEFMYTLPIREINYEIQERRERKTSFRQYEKMIESILKELKDLKDENGFHKLKYLYYECFQKEESDMEKMYQEMVAFLPKCSGGELSRMNYFIQLSSHQV